MIAIIATTFFVRKQNTRMSYQQYQFRPVFQCKHLEASKTSSPQLKWYHNESLSNA